MSHRNGFTLVEMLIALTIFGMLTAAGVALLSFSVRAQDMADRRLGETGDLRRTGAMLTADLAQATARIWRDGTGRSRPAFSGSETGEGTVMTLVRSGWDNPDGAPRSSLQRVVYRIRGGALERLAYPYVDGGAEPVAIGLMKGVRQIRARYRDDQGEWRESWDTTDPSRLPVAVELIAETEDHGTVRQLFMTGAGR